MPRPLLTGWEIVKSGHFLRDHGGKVVSLPAASRLTFAASASPAMAMRELLQGQEILFKCEDSRMWVADGSSLLELNPDTGDISGFALPVTPSDGNSSSFTSMLLAGGKLWIGTRRDGLIAFDTSSRTLTNYTLESGLMMNGVAALHLHRDRLWIGYAGGVGYYDMPNRRFVGMMNELPAALGGGPSSIVIPNQSREAPAPRAQFQAFATAPSGALWEATPWGGMLSFDAKSNRWNPTTLPCRCQSASLATAGNFLVVPCYEPSSWSDRDTEFGGLLIYDAAKGDCKRVGMKNGFPNNHLRSVAVDGTKAWLGGRGFVALVDLPAGKVEKVSQLKTDSRVRSMEINGNSLWFSAGPALYRLSRDGYNVDTAPVVASSQPTVVQQEEVKDEASRLLSDLKAARALTVERSEVRRVYGNTENDEYKALGEKFHALVRKVAATFPLIDLNTNKFFTFVLNQRGGQFDGFRFRNNSSEPQNFGWVFAFEEPRSMANWGVLSREPQPVVCSFIGGEPRLIYTNAPWRGRNVFFERTQSIRNKSILPGQEYILYFSFADARQNTIHFFCGLFPPNQELNSAELDKAFGLKGDSRYPAPFTTRQLVPGAGREVQ